MVTACQQFHNLTHKGGHKTSLGKIFATKGLMYNTSFWSFSYGLKLNKCHGHGHGSLRTQVTDVQYSTTDDFRA